MAFGPTKEAQNNPRRVYLKDEKKWVALGGEITIERKKPKRPSTIPEATSAQYEKKKHLTNLVTESAAGSSASKKQKPATNGGKTEA